MFTSHKQKAAFLQELNAHEAQQRLTGDLKKAPTRVSEQLQQLLIKLDCTISFYEAVPVKSDTSHILDHWFLRLLEDELGKYKTSAPVAELYRRRLRGDEPKQKEWQAAAAAAAAAEAAATAAWAAATAWAMTAAEAAGAWAWAEAEAAAGAAVETAWAQEDCYKRMRAALLRIAAESLI